MPSSQLQPPWRQPISPWLVKAKAWRAVKGFVIFISLHRLSISLQDWNWGLGRITFSFMIILLQGPTLLQEMYFSSKTEPLDRQNLNPNFYFQQPTLTQNPLTSDHALSKAISIIEQLKQNLSFALKINEALTQENQLLKANVERTTKKVNQDVLGWERKLREIQEEKAEIVELLEQTKSALLDTQQQYQQSKTQIESLNRIILQQKKSYSELQSNFLNQSLPIQSSTLNISKAQLHYISQLQHENQELQLRVKRLTQQLEKGDGKLVKVQKQNGDFRRWMAGVLGLQRVVEGSQRVLMREIQGRMVLG